MVTMVAENVLTLIANEVVALIDPIRRVIADDTPPHELAVLLRAAGWVMPGISEVDLSGLTTDLADLVAAIDALPAAVSAENLSDLTAAFGTVGDAISGLRDVGSSISDVATQIGISLSDAVVSELVDDVVDALVLGWLAHRHATGLSILQAIQLVEVVDVAPATADDGTLLRRSRRARRLRLAALPGLLSDPVGHLVDSYGFQDGIVSSLDAQVLALLVGMHTQPLLNALGGNLFAWPPWSPTHELPAELREAAGRTISAVLPLPTAIGTPLSTEFALDAELLGPSDRGQLDVAGPGVEIRPRGLIDLTTSIGSWTVAVAAEATDSVFVSPTAVIGADGARLLFSTTISPTTDRLFVFGGDHGSRLELHQPTVTVGVDLDGSADISVEVVLPSAALVVSVGDGDSFVASILPSAEMRVAGDVGLVWSRQGGLRLSGSTDLTMRSPLNMDILGLLVIEALQTSLEVSDSGFTIRFVIDGDFTLGPFSARIEGVGLRVLIHVDTSDGNLGIANLTVEFQPPTRFEFELAAGPVVGEGFVEYLADTGRYVGGLSLDVVAVGIDAFTIIDTSLPGDPDGFALFATLTLRFPSIPLGFGFSLSGLGGLLALNRCVDTEALALGLRDGAADAILFPEDPLRDADLLVAQIDEYFPILPGNTVVGPVAEIRWGVGDMVIGQLGVAISLPQALILVLASIEVVLPDRSAPLIELHLDVLGVLDIAEGSLLIVGSLYDSRLLGVIELSGDTALYVSWLDDPYFVMSVGGFHPGFTPPAYVPAILEDLRRMRAEVSVGEAVTASIEAYFAVTSNTVQFGGGFEVVASAKFLLTTYTARGWFDFDVLLQFAPLLIIADASAGVGVYANDKELLGVNLSVHLEGPQPWYASGNASFKFFGINVKFDFAVGGHAPPELRGSSDVLALVQAALNNPASWTAQHATVSSAGLRLASGTTDDLVRPDDVLVGRQTVAPFDRRMARFGETTPLQSEVSVTSTTVVAVTDGIDGDPIGDLDNSDALDWFAPAQYDVMADQSRLSAPSYEQMVAGVTIGGNGVAVATEAPILAPEGHETEVWSPATNTTVKYIGVVAWRSPNDVIAASCGARAMSTTTGAATDLRRVDLGGQSYVAIDSTTGSNLTDELTYSAAVAAAGAQVGARVVPAHAGVQA
jgi:hypothetical protein